VARRAARRRLLRLRRASGCLGTSRGSSRGSSRRLSSTTPPRAGSSSTTSPPPRVRVPRHVVRLNTRLVAPLVVDYSASRRLVVDYIAYAARLGASARRAAHRSSSTTSPTPRDRVPRHVTRLVAWLIAPLVVDYFTYAARPGALARRAARQAAHRRLHRLAQARRRLLRLRVAQAHRRLLRLAQARRRQLRLAQACCRLLRLRRTSEFLGTSRGSTHGSSRGSSSTTSPMSRVWVPRHVARLIACRQLLRLRHATGCLGTSRGSSRGSSRCSSSTTPPRVGSSSTTSPTPLVRVPRHVARLVTRLLVDYSVRRDFVLWPRWLYFSDAVRRDYLSRGNTGSTSSTPCTATTSSSGRIASTIHLD
jgi:hypothetical protein